MTVEEGSRTSSSTSSCMKRMTIGGMMMIGVAALLPLMLLHHDPG